MLTAIIRSVLPLPAHDVSNDMSSNTPAAAVAANPVINMFLIFSIVVEIKLVSVVSGFCAIIFVSDVCIGVQWLLV